MTFHRLSSLPVFPMAVGISSLLLVSLWLSLVFGLHPQYELRVGKKIEVQAHRGGLGMRTEESLHVRALVAERHQQHQR